ncbi:PQQ-binding-like beta-propeller repeat protein [Verrucomicrobiales bacterium]|nr:PQQ-binding-like beta-propeller repeat protein [Verrucomicrobiales bacterium]MDC0321832.1 PQQ-binding-like beta-propeller repeat protein [Verrucomicrobiales bacterium]
MKQLVWKFLKIITLLAILGFAPVMIWQQLASDAWFRYWWIIFAPVLALLMFLVWYAVFGKARAAKRILWSVYGFLGAVAAGFVFFGLFEYAGSSGGGSFPKYRFRFAGDTAPKKAFQATAAASGKVGAVAAEIDSAQFGGPNRDNHFPDAAVSLDFEKNPPEELWRQPIGDGWSGFAVVGNRAITQEQLGEDELVTCYDLGTGIRLWTHNDEGTRFTSAVGEDDKVMAVMGGEGPRATPTIHEKNVYSLGSTGVLNCLDLETGTQKWMRDTLAEFSAPLPKWGKSSAPLVIPDLGLVVVTAAEKNGPTLLAYKVDSGEPAWEYEGHGASYSSPRLLEIAGQRQIVSVNGRDLTGHEPDTGVELWRFEWPRENPKVCQPILVENDRILVSASYNMGTHLLQIRSNEGEWSVEPVWKSTKLKTKFSSPVVHDGFAYGLNEGRLACIDLETGDQQWRGEKYGFGQNLLVGDQILIQAEEPGDLVVAATNPEQFEETARIDTVLTAMTWNTPTLAGRYLLVRNGEEAICFRLAGK